MVCVCTLFEGDYHYGVGALANSLFAHGFRGTLWAGFRGQPPFWASAGRHADPIRELSVCEGLTLRFLPVGTRVHLTNYKPEFMLRLWEQHCSAADALFYFDPDITIKCRWSFFEEWVEGGVAVCQDVNGSMPCGHPVRKAWRRLLEPAGIRFQNSFDIYLNAGFAGVHHRDKAFLEMWQKVLHLIEASGTVLDSLGGGDRTRAFSARDQDALNIACAATDRPISPVGQDGMDFQWGGGGWIMSHALGPRKPWRKKFLLDALRGLPPSRADRAFFQHAVSPIMLYSPPCLLLKKLDLFAAKAVARVLR